MASQSGSGSLLSEKLSTEPNQSLVTTIKTLGSKLITMSTVSPLNTFLVVFCLIVGYLIYRDKRGKSQSSTDTEFRPRLEPFPKGDMTLEELRKYDGIKSEDGRVLLAINSEIYDVSKGYRFYGPDGPYSVLAGHDVTRAMATFDVDCVKDTWDDCSDLTQSQMTNATEWREQFKEKYDYIGRLVKTEKEKATPVQPADEEPDSEM